MSLSEWIQHQADLLVQNNLVLPLFALLIFISFAEAALFVGFVLPGETSLLIGGVLAHAGAWSFWMFWLFAVGAAIAGDSVGYEVGKHYGERIKSMRLGQLIGAKRWRVAHHVFDKYDGWAIFFGRAQALLRALVPALAGMHKVPYPTFLKWNASGGFVFGTVVVTLGYQFANHLSTIESVLRYWSIAFLLAVIVAVTFLKRSLEARIAE